MSCLGELAPVSGSEAARRRRANLRTQLPPHDVALAARHHATDQEKSEHTVCIDFELVKRLHDNLFLPLNRQHCFSFTKNALVF